MQLIQRPFQPLSPYEIHLSVWLCLRLCSRSSGSLTSASETVFTLLTPLQCSTHVQRILSLLIHVVQMLQLHLDCSVTKPWKCDPLAMAPYEKLQENRSHLTWTRLLWFDSTSLFATEARDGGTDSVNRLPRHRAPFTCRHRLKDTMR